MFSNNLSSAHNVCSLQTLISFKRLEKDKKLIQKVFDTL